MNVDRDSSSSDSRLRAVTSCDRSSEQPGGETSTTGDRDLDARAGYSAPDSPPGGEAGRPSARWTRPFGRRAAPAQPNRAEKSSDSTDANARTADSGRPEARLRCRAASSIATAPRGDHKAPTPPDSASTRLSVSSCRTMRPRLAPSDRRTAISRRRAARARSRLPTLAHASEQHQEHRDEHRREYRASRWSCRRPRTGCRRRDAAGASRRPR